jgi:hypothetical protein
LFYDMIIFCYKVSPIKKVKLHKYSLKKMQISTLIRVKRPLFEQFFSTNKRNYIRMFLHVKQLRMQKFLLSNTIYGLNPLRINERRLYW